MNKTVDIWKSNKPVHRKCTQKMQYNLHKNYVYMKKFVYTGWLVYIPPAIHANDSSFTEFETHQLLYLHSVQVISLKQSMCARYIRTFLYHFQNFAGNMSRFFEWKTLLFQVLCTIFIIGKACADDIRPCHWV